MKRPLTIQAKDVKVGDELIIQGNARKVVDVYDARWATQPTNEWVVIEVERAIQSIPCAYVAGPADWVKTNIEVP